MKKINSISYGGKILSTSLIFSLLIPCILKLIMRIFNSPILYLCIKVSFVFGVTAAFCLFILLNIEFYQDKKQVFYYEAQKNVKLYLGDGIYECQSCGSRLVKSNEKQCSVCGILFKDRGEKMLKANELSALAQTLFIPLSVRAEESKREQPLFMDKMAADILNQCDTSNIVTDGGEVSTHGILARTKIIDSQVREILDKYPNTTVINLGAGLDTRFFRLDNGTVIWYDLDLPEVISLRRQLITENNRLQFISGSLKDSSWLSEIQYSKNDNVLFIAEGLLMYFTEDEVIQILNLLTANFPGAHLLLDVVHSYFVGKKISSGFLWGIGRAEEIKNLNNEISVIQSWSTGNLLKQRQSLVFRLLNFLPSTKNRSQIIHLKFKK